MPKMTKVELVDHLKKIAVDNAGDEEKAHKEADTALLVFINDPDVTAAFDAIDKWYA